MYVKGHELPGFCFNSDSATYKIQQQSALKWTPHDRLPVYFYFKTSAEHFVAFYNTVIRKIKKRTIFNISTCTYD